MLVESYLELTPPFAPGKSIQDLVDEGVLSPAFGTFATRAVFASTARSTGIRKKPSVKHKWGAIW